MVMCIGNSPAGSLIRYMLSSIIELWDVGARGSQDEGAPLASPHLLARGLPAHAADEPRKDKDTEMGRCFRHPGLTYPSLCPPWRCPGRRRCRNSSGPGLRDSILYCQISHFFNQSHPAALRSIPTVSRARPGLAPLGAVSATALQGRDPALDRPSGNRVPGSGRAANQAANQGLCRTSPVGLLDRGRTPAHQVIQRTPVAAREG